MQISSIKGVRLIWIVVAGMIILIGGFLVVNSFRNQKKSTNKDFSMGTLIGQQAQNKAMENGSTGNPEDAMSVNCLSEAETILKDDQLLADTVSGMEAQGIYADTGIRRDDYLKNIVLKHFACKLSGNNDGGNETLKIAKEYTEKAQFPRKKNIAQWFVDLAEKKYSEPFVAITYNIAFGDLNRICPDQLPEMCLNGTIKEEGFKANETGYNNFCSTICSRLENNDPMLVPDFIENPNPKGLEGIVRNYTLSIGIGYRLGGQEMASRACDVLDQKERGVCLDIVKIIGISQIPCNEVSKNFSKAYCASPTEYCAQ